MHTGLPPGVVVSNQKEAVLTAFRLKEPGPIPGFSPGLNESATAVYPKKVPIERPIHSNVQ
jgi:hypothetical protein